MKHLKILIIGAVALAISAASVSAAVVAPKLMGRVNDYAHVLTAEQASTLEAQLKKIEDTTPLHDQVAVLAPDSLQGESVEIYSNTVFRAWGLGQKGVDNGVLIVIAPEERKIRIEVGTRLEGGLTDAQSELIIQNDIIPHLHKGSEDYFAAFQAATASIATLLATPAGAPIAPVDPRMKQSPAGDNPLAIIFAILVVCSVVGYFCWFFFDRDDASEDFDEQDRLNGHEDREESRTSSALLVGAAVGAGASESHREEEEEHHEEEEDDESSSSSLGSSSEESPGGFSGGGGSSEGGGASGSF